MVYRGIVRSGRVELDESVTLPDGTVVRVEPVEREADAVSNGEADPAYGLAEEAVPTGMADLAAEHDHYAHGAPKRGE